MQNLRLQNEEILSLLYEIKSMLKDTGSKEFIRLPEVMEKTGKSKATIYRDIKKGLFPSQIQNGLGTVAWLESDIVEWQQKQINLSAANDN